MPGFIAELPVMLSRQIRYKRITRKQYDALPDERRSVCRGYPSGKREYREKILLPPYENPYLIALLKKIYRKKPTIERFDRNGVEFVRITF